MLYAVFFRLRTKTIQAFTLCFNPQAFSAKNASKMRLFHNTKLTTRSWNNGCRIKLWRMDMTALLAMGTGVLMTAVAVFIAGLVIEVVMLAISRKIGPVPTRPAAKQTGKVVVIHLHTADNSTGMGELLEEAA
jgi:hypothetical protein